MKDTTSEKGSILIVDDDESTRNTLKLILGKKGYETDTAETGREALKKVRGNFFNMTLLDIKLPDMEGLELLEPLKKKHPDMAVILVTGYASMETAVQAIEKGVSAYITKPLNVNEMLITVENIIEKQCLIKEKRRMEEQLREYSENLERMVDERTKKLKRALHDTESARDKIDGILKSIGEGLIVTDINNRIVLMNRVSEELFDMRLSEVINRPIEYVINDKTLLNQLETTLSKDLDDMFDFNIIVPGTNENRFIQARTSLIRGVTGKKSGVVTTFYDITREHEIDRMKTEFISTAAHALRTPLTSIQGFSEILLTRDNIQPKEQKKFLTYINKQAVNLTYIISDLLDISRIETGQGFEIKKEPVNINEILLQIVNFFQDSSKKHNFEILISDKPVLLNIDKEKIDQALKNIFSNAVKYSPSGGLISALGELSDDYYLITVSDQGTGMTAEQVEKIFEKFYRADALNTTIEGTGLGMSITKHIIELHGGKIWVKSERGKGTIVRFTIPL